MLFEEAIWVGKQALSLPLPNKRVLNVGSNTLSARTMAQPHVQRELFGPLEARGFEVTHTDLQAGAGVDLVGDLTDGAFLERLARKSYGLVLCTNVLEHVTERRPLVDALSKLPCDGGYLVVTVPRHYPYHYDPIDTMFRPDVQELSGLFPRLSLGHGEVLRATRLQARSGIWRAQANYFAMLADNPKLALLVVVRALMPFYKPSVWRHTVEYLLKPFVPFCVTCVVLRRPPSLAHEEADKAAD